MERLYFLADIGPHDSADLTSAMEAAERPSRKVVPESEANLVGSLCDDGVSHMPVLDIDRMAVRVVPSTTPGNFHLYIDKPMPWSDYAELIEMLAVVGIIERGYANASLERRATFVRKPGVLKV